MHKKEYAKSHEEKHEGKHHRSDVTKTAIKAKIATAPMYHMHKQKYHEK